MGIWHGAVEGLELSMVKDAAAKICNQYRRWKPSVATKNILYQALKRERRKSFGAGNPDRTFYVVRSIDDQSRFYTGPVHNLLANYFYVISHLQYAQSRGWIPVVDQLNYPVYNRVSVPVNGSMNPWEYFWEQPGGVALEEVYRSRHVVLSKRSWFWQWDMGYDAENYLNTQTVERFHLLSEMAALNAPTEQHVRAVRERLLPEEDKTLGISYRFGGHARNSPYHGSGHPVQPEISRLIEIAGDRLEKWQMKHIFFASDESGAVQQFQMAFGERLITLPRKRADAGSSYSAERPNPMYLPEQSYRTALDYLTEMELLSHCGALIGSITSGLRYAIVRNGGRYANLEILDCGLFPDHRRKQT